MAKNINVILSLQDRFTTKMSQASVATLQFKRNLAIAQATSDKFAGVMHKMETAAAVGVTAAATATTAAVKSSLGAYEEFNKSMNNVAGVKAISTASEEFKSLINMAKEASNAVGGTTYKDAADTLYYMSLAGWSTEQSMESLNYILKAVRINGENTQETADAVTDSMTALGLASSQTEEYIDKCAAVQSNSNTNMLQLNNALIKCGALMKDLGIETRDTNGEISSVTNDTMALIGALSSAGKKGEEAGTAVRSLYQRFMKDTAEAQAGLDEIGLSVYTDTGNMKEIPNLFEEMYEKLQGMTNQNRNSAISKIGGRFANELQVIMDAMTKVGETGETGYTMYQKLKSAIEDSKGAADHYLAAINSGWSGTIAEMSSKWFNFREEVGETIAPYAIDAMDYIMGKLPTLEKWLKTNLPTALNKGKEIVIEIKNTLEEFKPAMEWIVEHWKQIATVASTAYVGMGAFRLGTAGVEAYDTLGKITKGIGKEKAAKAASFGNDVAKAKGLTLYDFLTPEDYVKKGKNKGKIKADVVKAGVVKDIISDRDMKKAEKIEKIFSDFEFAGKGIIVPEFNHHSGAYDVQEYMLYKQMFGAAGTATATTASTNAAGVATTGAAGIGAAGTAAEAAGIGAAGTAATAGTSVAGTVGGLGLGATLGIIAAIIVTLVGAWKKSEIFRNSIAKLGETMKPVVKLVKDGFEKFKPVLSSLGDMFGEVFGFAGDVLGTIVDAARPFLKVLIDILVPIADAGWSVFCGVVGTLAAGIKDLFSGLRDCIGKVREFASVGEEKLKPVKEAVDKYLLEPIKEAFGWISDLFDKWNEVVGAISGESPYDNDNGGYVSFQLGRSVDTMGKLGAGSGENDSSSGRSEAEGGSDIPHKALGTNYWRGGITSVNERGGEIMDLPKGTRIIPADKSKKIADNGDKGVTVIVNIENYYGEDEAYINRIGSEVGYRLAQVMQ